MKHLMAIFFLVIAFGNSHAHSTNGNFPNCISVPHWEDPAFNHLKNEVVCYLRGSWCSEEKTRLIMDTVFVSKPEVCVEIGVYSGFSALPIAAALKHLGTGILYAIDAWSNWVATRDMSDDDPNKAWWSQTNMPAALDQFQTALKDWDIGSQCKIIPKPSNAAIERISEIDFLHLDGNYSEARSVEDVELYLPKVKKGGYVLFSNAHLVVNNHIPKRKALQRLLDSCTIVDVIENCNCILVRKR